MIGFAKRQIRIWERDGKFPLLTRLATFLWLQFHNAHDWMFMRTTMKSLNSDKLPDDPEEAVKLVMQSKFGRAIRPMQVTDELVELIRLVAEKRPVGVIEIGTARGGTLLLLSRFASPDATIVSIDLPYGRNGGGYPRWKEQIYRKFAKPGQSLHLLRADSHAPETAKQVSRIFDQTAVEFLLVDADHSYSGAKQDFETYRTLTGKGSVIALHDILPNPEDPSIDVNRLWLEIENTPSLRTKRIVKSDDQGHSGIGLVFAD